MYNYNTNEGGTGAFIRDLVIKLIFVAILILLILWLYPKPDMKPYYDRFFTENINLMKDTAKAYYTNERLPKEVDDKVTMKLSEMVNKHLILNLTDKNGDFCDTKNSYVEVTKLKTEYAMKVFLSCGDEYDYIIEYIGCTTVCENCGQTPLVAEPVKTVTKPATVVKPTPTTPTTPVKPTQPTTTTLNVYGKAPETSIGNWISQDNTTTTSTINGITTTVSKYDSRSVAGNVAYQRKTATVYSGGYLTDQSKTGATYDYKGVRLLNLTNLGMSYAAQSLPMGTLNFTVDSWSKFTSISDYQAYIDNRARTFYTAVVSPANADVHSVQGPTAAEIQKSTITDFKIIPTTGTDQWTDGKPTAVWNDQYKTFQIYTRAWVYNKAYITPYYDAKLGFNIYFLLHKFNVSWNEPTTTASLEYRYLTSVSYEDKTVVPGSAEEAYLKANGYVLKSTKTVNL